VVAEGHASVARQFDCSHTFNLVIQPGNDQAAASLWITLRELSTGPDADAVPMSSAAPGSQLAGTHGGKD